MGASLERSPSGICTGTALFILFIKILPDSVRSSIKIFADDTEIYSSVSVSDRFEQLQKDLDEVTAWSVRWYLLFNEEKCKALHLGPSNPGHSYTQGRTVRWHQNNGRSASGESPVPEMLAAFGRRT